MSYKESLLYLYSKPDVTLVAGEEEIGVHESVIAVYSDFFKAALNSGLKESRERRIEINEIEPEILTVVLNWLYRVPLTPLFNTDITRVETLGTLLSDDITKIKKIFQAFDFLQIKGAGIHYVRFLEDKLRESGPNIFPVTPTASRNVATALNEVYRCGSSITESSLSALVKEIYKNSGPLLNNYIRELGNGLRALKDPDSRFLQDISVALTNVLMEAKKR